MKRSRASVLIRIGVLAAGLVLLGLAGYFTVTDLDEADKLASVLSALTGLTGLAFSVAGAVLAFRSRPPDPDAAPPRPEQRAGQSPEEQTVHNIVSGTVHGQVFQGRDFVGGITLGRTGPPPPEPPSAP